MWKNERKHTIVFNILIFVVLAIVVAALGFSYLKVNRQIAEEDRQLSAASNDQRQQLSDTRQEKLEAVQRAYEVDMNTVAQYMPGIVCWGDSLTAGTSGNVSYPYTLQRYIDTYLCNIYSFRSTVENSADFPTLKWSDYTVSIPVVNMGAGQENSATILGRAGVAPYVTSADFVIPAGTKGVTIRFAAPDGREVAPLSAGATGINPVTIAGVQGTLSMVASATTWQGYDYQFTRLEEGTEVPVKAGTQIITDAADKYKDYIHIVWLGTYDGYRSAEQIVDDVKQLLSRQAGNPERYLVLGPCSHTGNWTANVSTTLDAIDSAMLYAFGNRYVNVRKYLIEDGLRDAGMGQSGTDATDLSRGLVPTSFRSNAAGADLNGVAYKLIGKLVYERMDFLGYFNEIREELGLNSRIQDILKNDPTYFEKLLRVG